MNKITPSDKQSVAQVSRDTGIAIPTLYKWKKLFSNQGAAMPTKSTPAYRRDAKAKLDVITGVAAMNEIQRSEYCRQHGIFPEQIEQVVEQSDCCYKVCGVIGISWRKCHRRIQTDAPLPDKRLKGSQKRVQPHALTEQEQILQVCNSSEYQNLPHSQIVSKLADSGCYIA